MFPNHKNLISKDKVARASRKTDVYAFAVVMFEIISEKIAFAQHYTELALASHVQRGKREDLTMLPKDVPYGVIQLIQSCWDTDRKNRKTAVECVVELHPIYLILSEIKTVDVLLCPSSSFKKFSRVIFHYFLRYGFTVMYEDYDYREACEGVAKDIPLSIAGGSFSQHEVEIIPNSKYETICNNLKSNYRVRITSNSETTMNAIFNTNTSNTNSTNLTLDVIFLHELIKKYESQLIVPENLTMSKEETILEFDNFDTTDFEEIDQIFKCVRERLLVN